MPAGSGKKGPQGASDEIGRHKDRVYPVGGGRAKFEQRGLVTNLDTLHPDVNQDDACNNGNVRVLSGIKD